VIHNLRIPVLSELLNGPEEIFQRIYGVSIAGRQVGDDACSPTTYLQDTRILLYRKKGAILLIRSSA